MGSFVINTLCRAARVAVAGLVLLLPSVTAGMVTLWPGAATATESPATGNSATGNSATGNSAVVVMYHRFGDDRYPSTNIRLDQFEAHLAELKSGKYTVLPLPEITAALKSGTPLPDRAVGISIDDAYLSVYTEAWPRLKKAGIPFTLFVATDAVDKGVTGYMTWAQIRELADAGVTIGSQTASHLHMPDADEARNADELKHSNARFEEELGKVPTLLAYPFGEASHAVEKLAKELGFSAAFGQHSGVIHASLGLFYLPRFAMNEAFGDGGRFNLAVNALPIPATDFTPSDHMIVRTNPPPIGFTVTEDVSGLDRLSCFSSHEGRARIERLGPSRFEIRVKEPFPKGRVRINCTAPAGEGRWRWLGRQFYVAQ